MKLESRKFGISDKRGRQATSLDPYLPDEGLREPVLCGDCGSFYRNKRWYANAQLSNGKEEIEGAVRRQCPACRKIADGYAEGEVTLSGDYLWDHEEEIRNILRNEEQKARAKNPLERIMRMERQEGALVIETTEEKLAEHLGRALKKAHQGKLEVSWDADHDFCRVQWSRVA